MAIETVTVRDPSGTRWRVVDSWRDRLFDHDVFLPDGKVVRREVLKQTDSRSVEELTLLSGERVVFGATVTLTYIDDDQEKKFKIVGEPTADVGAGRINVGSPLVRAIIGKEVGDEVKIPGKGGPKLVEISDVAFV